MPRLSVILPALNAEDTVARAVSSTLRALPADAELVVLDDGSTDDTANRAVEGEAQRASSISVCGSRAKIHPVGSRRP